MNALTKPAKALRLTDEEFEQLAANRDFERTLQEN